MPIQHMHSAEGRVEDLETALTAACAQRDYAQQKNTLLEAELAVVKADRDRAEAYILAIWRKNLLPTPLGDTLFRQLTETPDQ